jgi:hypothetical protein
MNPETLQQRMADIIVPVPDDLTTTYIGILITVVILLVLTGWLVKRFGRRRRRDSAAAETGALHQLDLVKQDWRAGHIDSRQAAFRLATVLRLGLRLAQLPPLPPTPAVDDRQWQQTISRLNALRYPSALTQKLTDDLFTSVHHILCQRGQEN